MEPIKKLEEVVETVKNKVEEKRKPGLFYSPWFWWPAIMIIYIILAVAAFLAIFWFSVPWAIGGGIGIFILCWVATLAWGFQIVPEKREWRIQILGRDVGEWGPGFHVLLPFVAQIYTKFFKGEQYLQLYMDEKHAGGLGAGDVDFQDGTAKVIAMVYFHFEDTYKASYNIANPYNAIGDKVDGGLRSFLADQTIDQATKIRVHDVKHEILNQSTKKKPRKADDKKEDKQKEDKNTKKRGQEQAPKQSSEDNGEEGTLYDQFHEWGIVIHSIAITDIVLDKSIIEARQKILEAEKEAEAMIRRTKGERESIILRADGEREASRLKGVGHLQEQLSIMGLQDSFTWDDNKKELISKPGITLDQDLLERARRFMAELQLYEGLGDKTVIYDGANANWPALGAMFGTGQRVTENKTQTKKESQEDTDS